MPNRRIPTAIKIANGNPGKRPLNKAEPQPAVIDAEPPSYLSRGAKQEFRRIAPILRRMQVFTEADVDHLAVLCADLDSLKRLQRKVGKASFAFDAHTMRIVHSITVRVASAFREFGMTPAARTKLTTEKPNANAAEIQRLMEALEKPREDTARLQ